RIVIISKLISFLLIFIFVTSNEDFVLIMTIILIQNILSLLISFYIIFEKMNIKIKKSSLNDTWYIAKDSTEYFISRLGVSLYSTCGSFFLGIFSGSLHQVAIYGAAEQLYRAGVSAMSSISSPLTPFMARTKDFNLLFKVIKLALLLTISGSLFGFIVGDYIINIIYGVNYENAKPVLNVFMITIIFSVIGMILGYPALIPLGKARSANYSVMYAGILQILFIITMLLFEIPFNAINIAISYLLCDIFMFTYRGLIFIKGYKIKK
ncbi:oligosaccharide flippase family protein, partial [Proteus mirabilis]